MKHIARKRFGQHFLTDGAIIDGIVDAIDPRPGDPMVEIGPGLAALTQPLVERLGRLSVIELDRDLAIRLREHPHLNVIESDVLRVDFTQLAASLNTTQLRVVGNLPYNISSPILFHLLDHVDAIQDQHFMLQQEVVDRMVASPSTAACTGTDSASEVPSAAHKAAHRTALRKRGAAPCVQAEDTGSGVSPDKVGHRFS